MSRTSVLASSLSEHMLINMRWRGQITIFSWFVLPRNCWFQVVWRYMSRQERDWKTFFCIRERITTGTKVCTCPVRLRGTEPAQSGGGIHLLPRILICDCHFPVTRNKASDDTNNFMTMYDAGLVKKTGCKCRAPPWSWQHCSCVKANLVSLVSTSLPFPLIFFSKFLCRLAHSARTAWYTAALISTTITCSYFAWHRQQLTSLAGR